MKTKPIEYDSKPEESVAELLVTNQTDINSYPEVLILSLDEKQHCYKVELVLLYHCSNEFKDPEGYVDNLVYMFYSFRYGCVLKVAKALSYSSKL